LLRGLQCVRKKHIVIENEISAEWWSLRLKEWSITNVLFATNWTLVVLRC
jgi:hypothetical protein